MRPSRLLHRRASVGAEPGGWLTIPAGDPGVKPAAYLPLYEELLGGLRDQRFNLLELGVWKGDSLVMWRDAFQQATIVGVDLSPPELDLGPRVHVVRGDQADGAFLDRLRIDHAPGGFDVIIDDASHVGQLSARSLRALYRQHLRPGGLYVIEDWGTGYMGNWPDGAAPAGVIGAEQLDEAGPVEPNRMPSHDSGMVGLVKRLVDHTAAGTLRAHQPEWIAEALPIEWMQVYDGIVVLKKAMGTPCR